MQALDNLRVPRVSRRARNCLLRQWLHLLRTSGVMSLSGASVHRRALAFREPGGYAFIQRFSKINISLTESIAK